MGQWQQQRRTSAQQRTGDAGTGQHSVDSSSRMHSSSCRVGCCCLWWWWWRQHAGHFASTAGSGCKGEPCRTRRHPGTSRHPGTASLLHPMLHHTNNNTSTVCTFTPFNYSNKNSSTPVTIHHQEHLGVRPPRRLLCVTLEGPAGLSNRPASPPLDPRMLSRCAAAAWPARHDTHVFASVL